LKGDQVFYETIRDHFKKNGLHKSLRNLGVVLSFPKTYDSSNRLGDNRMKVTLNVSYNSFVMYFMISSKKLNVFQ
jgi:hypothetical protein